MKSCLLRALFASTMADDLSPRSAQIAQLQAELASSCAETAAANELIHKIHEDAIAAARQRVQGSRPERCLTVARSSTLSR